MSGKRAFWDTNLFIYLIEENPLYLDKIDALLAHLETKGYEIITSALTVGEILTKPYKDDRLDLVEKYQNFFEEIFLVDLDRHTASRFAQMRARCNIKTPDAIQIASAIEGSADLFITNDEKLKRCAHKDFQILLLSNVALSGKQM